VKHEREPIGWRQRFKHHEKSQTDGIGQQRFLLWIHSALTAHDRVGQACAKRLVTANLPRLQHVKAHARDDRRQPAT
jgi:hypothetical protein